MKQGYVRTRRRCVIGVGGERAVVSEGREPGGICTSNAHHHNRINNAITKSTEGLESII
jgi:hypothetical protein